MEKGKGKREKGKTKMEMNLVKRMEEMSFEMECVVVLFESKHVILITFNPAYSSSNTHKITSSHSLPSLFTHTCALLQPILCVVLSFSFLSKTIIENERNSVMVWVERSVRFTPSVSVCVWTSTQSKVVSIGDVLFFSLLSQTDIDKGMECDGWMDGVFGVEFNVNGQITLSFG